MSSSVPAKVVTKAAMLMKAYSSGLGAVQLASSVQALRLQINRVAKRPGEREFLKQVLPRLAYNNPKLPIHISYLPRAQEVKSAEEEPQQTTSRWSIAAKSTMKKNKKRGPQKPAMMSIEYADMPSRQILMGDKTATVISQELLDLAKFTEQALQAELQSNADEIRRAAKGRTPGQTAADVKKDTFAPEATATSLMGSAEGQADVEGVGAIDAKA